MKFQSFRERLLVFALTSLTLIAASTELLSTFHAIGRLPILLEFLILASAAVFFRRPKLPLPVPDWYTAALLLASLGLWTVTGLTALISPPNSSDAMAYHMPRVVFWIQQRSVEFFPTPYLNQIMLQPLHEYVLLHFQLLAGSDRLANAAAWLSTGGYAIAVSLIARELGAASRGQALAAFLALSLPNGLLQASGVKNEALLTLLLTTAVHFGLRRQAWPVALAIALACLTKGTAYLFAGPLLFAVFPRALPQTAVAVLLLNAPFYWRNIDLSGSPLGFDSAHADGRYRWQNDSLGWQPLVSNALRTATEAIGDRNETWNQAAFTLSLKAHKALGLDPQDKSTTWPYTEYVKPRNANHETDANNRFHLLLFLATLPFLRHRTAWRILAAMAIGAMFFCFYLKWQPFMLRMWLPLYVLAMPIAAITLARLHWLPQAALCIFLLNNARLPALKNWVRPLRGPGNMFTLTREDLYYSDMRPWPVRDQYNEIVAKLRASDCRDIAFDINQFQLMYPIQALLLEAHPSTRFTLFNVENPSREYEDRFKHIKPCAAVCLACDNWLYLNLPR
jgi:hypothetical protein